MINNEDYEKHCDRCIYCKGPIKKISVFIPQGYCSRKCSSSHDRDEDTDGGAYMDHICDGEGDR
jgi:hypothetical protein